MTSTVSLRTLFSSTCLIWALAACNSEVTVTVPPPEPPQGAWQATITLPGGDIETAFEIRKTENGYIASLVNGQERIAVDEVSYAGGEMQLRFTVFNNEIRADYIDGKLVGEVILVKRYGETQSLPFSARPGTEHPHASYEAASVDMSGRWSALFVNEDGTTSPSIGEFAQRGSRLFGTFVNVEGDHRYLAGHVVGRKFELSTFDGAHAFLFRGTVEGNRIVDGNFWSGTDWHQEWSAERNANAALPDAYSTTHLKPDHEGLAFSFPNQDGVIVSLADEKFAGKVVIVALAGTWCPNCNDEARFLAALDREFADKDLAIVALMFEHFDDMEIASRQVKRFRAKHSITFGTLIAGISDKADAAHKLPDLDGVMAFPTTIFIDRNGKVRTIHTGFRGPGTGEHHEQLKSEFTALVSKLVKEKPAPVEPVPADPLPADDTPVETEAAEPAPGE